MSVKIITQWWTTTQTGECMGFVLTENDSGTRKIYCGTGLGHDEESDSQRIMNNGGKVQAFRLENMLAQLKETDNFE